MFCFVKLATSLAAVSDDPRRRSGPEGTGGSDPEHPAAPGPALAFLGVRAPRDPGGAAVGRGEMGSVVPSLTSHEHVHSRPSRRVDGPACAHRDPGAASQEVLRGPEERLCGPKEVGPRRSDFGCLMKGARARTASGYSLEKHRARLQFKRQRDEGGLQFGSVLCVPPRTPSLA